MMLLIKKHREKQYNKGEYWFYNYGSHSDLYLIEDILEKHIILTGISKDINHVIKERYCKKHFFGGSANPKSYTRWRKATASEIQNVKKDATTN